MTPATPRWKLSSKVSLESPVNNAIILPMPHNLVLPETPAVSLVRMATPSKVINVSASLPTPSAMANAVVSLVVAARPFLVHSKISVVSFDFVLALGGVGCSYLFLSFAVVSYFDPSMLPFETVATLTADCLGLMDVLLYMVVDFVDCYYVLSILSPWGGRNGSLIHDS